MNRDSLRLIDDPPLNGRTNMARDEALLARVGEGQSPPTLRLYQWDPPTISLGYFQPYADFETLEPPARDLAVVRRPTGGGAILHDRELTYSLALPLGHPLVAGNPRRLYEWVHDAVIAVLKTMQVEAARCGVTDDSGPRRGPFFCFARRHCTDVMVGDCKLAGSAQRRTRTAILQHGSIVLANRFPQQPTASLGVPYDDALRHVRSALPLELARVTQWKIDRGNWSNAESDLARQLVAKYAGDDWTRRA